MKPVIVITLILSGIVINAGCNFNFFSSKKELTLINRKQLEKAGDKYYPVYTQLNNGELQDDSLQKYINETGKTLVQYIYGPEMNYKFNVVNSSYPNVYALPGGKISVTRGLLASLDNEDQVAGILGHEIALINQRFVSSIYTNTLLAKLMLNNISFYLEQESGSSRNLYFKKGFFETVILFPRYTLNNETEADRLCVKYMVRSEYNPEAYIEVLKKIKSLREKEPSRWEELTVTHPLTLKRINNLRKQIPDDYKKKPYKVKKFNMIFNNLKRYRNAYKYYDKGIFNINRKDYNEANKNFKKAIEIYNNESIFYAYLGYAEQKLGSNISAIELSKKAILLYPGLYFSWLVKGISEVETKNYKTGLADLQNADSLLKDVPAAAFFMAKAYDKLGIVTLAIDNYKRFLSLTKESEYEYYAKMRLEILLNEFKI